MTHTRAGLALLGALAVGACTRTVIVRTAPPPADRPVDRPPPGPSTAVTLGIPPGHLPRPGQCRVWIPGTPPGQQLGARSRACRGIAAVAPAGSWIIYRPSRDRRVVHVRVVDARRPGFVIRVRFFDYDTGRFIREGGPEESRDEDDEDNRGRPGERDRGKPEQENPYGPPRERPVQPPPQPPPPPPPPPAPPPVPSEPALDIPPGHLPEPGECRLWIPGTPPGQQPGPRSRPCAGLAAIAPAGSWIIYRPSNDRRVVHVRIVDDRRAGAIVRVRFFDFDSGRFLREGSPDESPDEPADSAGERPDDHRQRPERPAEPARDRPRPFEPPRERPVEPPPAPPPAPPASLPVTPPAAPPAAPPAPPAGPPAASETPSLDVPAGQLPDPGECRVWIPGTSPGRQPRPKTRPCEGIAAAAPAGSWIIYRPGDDRKVVHVRVVDERRAGVVIRVRIFDVETGKLVREENP